MAFWKSAMVLPVTPAMRPPSTFLRMTLTRGMACFSTSIGLAVRPKSRPRSYYRSSVPRSWQGDVIIRRSNAFTRVPLSSTVSAVRSLSSEPVEFNHPLPASDVDPMAVERETEIKSLADAGMWKEARKVLTSIREDGIKPSMEASMDVVAVCRRALQFDGAQVCYSEMITEHLPENPIKTFAADMPENDTKRVCERSLAVAMMMEEDPDNVVEKDEETYRGLLLTFQDDSAWQLSLLMAAHAQREGIVLEVYSVNAICTTLSNAGYEDVGVMVYENTMMADTSMLSEETRLVCEDPWKSIRQRNTIDLHNLTVSHSIAVVRAALLDLFRQPESRPYLTPDKTIYIITGVGNNSEGGEAVIKPNIISLLNDLQIHYSFQRNNPGCVEMEPTSTKAFMKRTKSKKGAVRLPRGPLIAPSTDKTPEEA